MTTPLEQAAERLDRIFHDDVCDCGDPDDHRIRAANIANVKRALETIGFQALLAVAEAAQAHLDALNLHNSKYAPGPPPWPVPTGSVADTSRCLADALTDLTPQQYATEEDQ